MKLNQLIAEADINKEIRKIFSKEESVDISGMETNYLRCHSLQFRGLMSIKRFKYILIQSIL